MGNKVEYFAIREKGAPDDVPAWHQGGTGCFRSGRMQTAKMYRSPFQARKVLKTFNVRWNREENKRAHVDPNDFEIVKLELRTLAIVQDK